jgi:transposase InsO family protein
VSEATVYRLLKDHGLITSPAFILMKAADCFANPTTAPNQLWQIDFTYLKVIGWGCFYLSTVPDDFSRYILCRSGLPQNSLPRSVSTRRSLIVSRQLKASIQMARLLVKVLHGTAPAELPVAQLVPVDRRSEDRRPFLRTPRR